MRTGKLYINNLDAYTEYGVFLAKDRGGTYDNISVLMTPPPAKKHTTIDYRECDGEEVDVSGVRFVDGEQEFRTKYKNFIDVLKSGMINMRVTETGKTYKFYYQSCPGMVMKTRLKTTGKLAAMWTIKFREPKPEF